jgi:DNA-binding MarR family transcriptional regulator
MARRFLQIATAIWAEACAEEPLSNLEFGALGTLQVEPNIDRNGLAASIGVDRTNIGLIVGELERRGFVERSVNPNDRRAQVMRMTRAGEQALKNQGRKTAIAREKILAPLTSAERETLYDLLERIIAANERYSIPGAGRRKRSR